MHTPKEVKTPENTRPSKGNVAIIKLAEALERRSGLKITIDDITSRITANSVVQEGISPTEDPKILLYKLYAKIREFEDLDIRIKNTNLHTKTESGMTLIAAVAKHERLLRLRGILRAVVKYTSRQQRRYTITEIENVATMDIDAIQEQIDDLDKQIFTLDAEIQAANWANDLV